MNEIKPKDVSDLSTLLSKMGPDNSKTQQAIEENLLETPLGKALIQSKQSLDTALQMQTLASGLGVTSDQLRIVLSEGLSSAVQTGSNQARLIGVAVDHYTETLMKSLSERIGALVGRHRKLSLPLEKGRVTLPELFKLGELEQLAEVVGMPLLQKMILDSLQLRLNKLGSEAGLIAKVDSSCTVTVAFPNIDPRRAERWTTRATPVLDPQFLVGQAAGEDVGRSVELAALYTAAQMVEQIMRRQAIDPIAEPETKLDLKLSTPGLPELLVDAYKLASEHHAELYQALIERHVRQHLPAEVQLVSIKDAQVVLSPRLDGAPRRVQKEQFA